MPPVGDAAFVCAIENVLDVYKRAYNPDYPVVNMDESSKQLTKEVRGCHFHHVLEVLKNMIPSTGEMERALSFYLRKRWQASAM